MKNLKPLAQNLKELSTIYPEAIPNTNWTSAICMLLVEDHLAFIKRSDLMPSHKGQVGFFGGHKKGNETEPAETALRELIEESGLNLEHVEYLGLIKPVYTTSKKAIMPVLARYNLGVNHFLANLSPNSEWNELRLVPLAFLHEINNWQVATIQHEANIPIGFCHLPRELAREFTQGEASDFLLWGASARMVWNLFNSCK